MKNAGWSFLFLIFAGTVAAQYWDDPSKFPAYYFVFGVVGCLLLLLLTKVVAKKLIMRKEDYYDRS